LCDGFGRRLSGKRLFGGAQVVYRRFPSTLDF
jgi:hypothetical protein